MKLPRCASIAVLLLMSNSGQADSSLNPEPPNRGEVTATVDSVLAQAYRALQQGQIDNARHGYRQWLAAEPHNADALLGLAAIAMRENETGLAAQHYLQIIAAEPQHALAQAGLLALIGPADPASAVTRLKQLLARKPSAFIYFTLGNLYAEQAQWPAAQIAYFQAHHLEPSNPDYAFNLGVGLEHIGQSELALVYYRRAIAFALEKYPGHFDCSVAQARVQQLESILE